MKKQELIEIIDQKIQNMGTPKVYHPKRLKPHWNSLKTDTEKLNLFEKYISNPKVSKGFDSLLKAKLCSKTLEAIILETPEASKHLSEDYTKVCEAKFKKYKSGKSFLQSLNEQADNGLEKAGFR